MAAAAKRALAARGGYRWRHQRGARFQAQSNGGEFLRREIARRARETRRNAEHQYWAMKAKRTARRLAALASSGVAVIRHGCFLSGNESLGRNVLESSNGRLVAISQASRKRKISSHENSINWQYIKKTTNSYYQENGNMLYRHERRSSEMASVATTSSEKREANSAAALINRRL